MSRQSEHGRTILTLTLNPAIDKSSTVEQVGPDRKLRCSEPAYEPGGGGINVARVAQELGAEATALWLSGGTMGKLLEESLKEYGVEHRPVPCSGMTRENFMVYERSSGRQFRFNHPGPEVGTRELDRTIEAIRSFEPRPAFLVLSGSLPPGLDDDAYARVSRERPTGCRVILDTSGPALQAGLDGTIYAIKPNIRELGQLAGRDIESDDEILEVSRTLIAEKDLEVVIISRGSGGAVLVTSDLFEEIAAPTVKVRSKVGAGDSMVAGLVTGLSLGLSLSEAALLAVAAGTAAVMTEGTELCRKADAEKLYDRLSRRRAKGG